MYASASLGLPDVCVITLSIIVRGWTAGLDTAFPTKPDTSVCVTTSTQAQTVDYPCSVKVWIVETELAS